MADGKRYNAPKTERRRVLTPRAVGALDQLPPRLDSPLMFPAPEDGFIDLDNWRLRDWYPALDAAGIERRGPYCLRHVASEALHAGVSIWDLSKVVGVSVRTIEKHYGHLVGDSEQWILSLLNQMGGP